jgi:hypothetical protein
MILYFGRSTCLSTGRSNSVNDLELDLKKFLSLVTELSEVFSKQPGEEYLHIIVQGPPVGELSVIIITLSSTLMAECTSCPQLLCPRR